MNENKRILEVFTGAYASGKSETALNRAIKIYNETKDVTLVDLDTVEPAYCLRPIISELEKIGLKIIAQRNYFGLGEAGSYVNGEQINALQNDGNIIIDVGYGASGLDILDILNGIEDQQNLKIYIVVNTSKFETRDKESILEYLDFSQGEIQRPWKKFSGIISNTHFSDETTSEDIIRGYNIVKEVSDDANIPVRAIGADEKFKSELGESYDGVEIWYLKRYMPKALW